MTTVLVVDDEAIVAADVAQRLTRAGYDVPSVVATSEAALRAIDELRPDLVLMDILLTSGKDDAEMARDVKDRFEIPVLFLAGQADEATQKRVKDTGAYGVVLKPIDTASLLPVVELALARHAFEVQLKESESRFQSVADSAVEAIFSVDMQGTVTFWNKAAERTFGWTVAEIENQSITTILPESAQTGFFEMLSALGTHQAYGPPSSTLWRKKDGTEFAAEPSFSVWKTKERTFATATVRDISERRAIIDSIQAGIVLIDPITHKIVDVNTSAVRLFGASKEAVIGSVCHRFICPAEMGRCPISDLGQTVDSAERVLLTAEGKGRPVLKSVSTVTLSGHEYLLESFIDISDRKQMERALLESETYYRAIFESAATGMAILEEDMTVAMVNSKLERLTGFTKDEVEGLKRWTELVAPEDRDVVETVHRARQLDPASAPKGYEFTVATKDGTRREAFTSVASIAETRRSVVSTVDITELKAAQEAVRKQAAMLYAAHDCIIALDPEGTITYWNRGAERLYGWTKQEAEGQNANALLRTQFPESREDLWPKLMESGLWDGELINVTRDGVPVTVASSWTLLTDERGNVSAILEINSDITERKKAELALAESEAKLSVTFATMADGIVIAALDETVTDCNEAILRLTQRSGEDIIGKSFADLLPPEFRSQLADAHKLLVDAVLALPSSGYSKTMRTDSQLLRKDGERVDIEANISLIEDTAKQPVAFLIVARDVTERKQMECQLDTTLDDLKRSNAELEQFAYIASHDLQEPLRMITSYIQIIAQDYREKLDTDADQYIAFIVEGANRMRTLINDLLEYSRLGTRGEPFMPTSMSGVLSKAVANLEVTIDENHAVITHDQLPTVFGDESQLIQVFQNLLGNAIKFRSDDTPIIHVGVDETKHDWVFSVSDNGIGINMEYAERIFAIFQRLHTREDYPGTGIGLAVVKKIVERHGGRIWVESEPAKGSAFYFALPKKEDNML